MRTRNLIEVTKAATYFDHPWIKIRIERWAIWNKIWIDILSNLVKFEEISGPGASKINQKSVPGPSWGTPGRPRSARGQPGASPTRSRSAPRASRKRPLSTKWSNLSGLELEQSQEPKFGSHFERAGPQMIRILDWFLINFVDLLIGSWSNSGNQKTTENQTIFVKFRTRI